MNFIIAFLFGCGHPRATFPITIGRRTYQVCHDCGVEIPYDWAEMRRGRPGQSSISNQQSSIAPGVLRGR